MNVPTCDACSRPVTTCPVGMYGTICTMSSQPTCEYCANFSSGTTTTTTTTTIGPLVCPDAGYYKVTFLNFLELSKETKGVLITCSIRIFARAVPASTRGAEDAPMLRLAQCTLQDANGSAVSDTKAPVLAATTCVFSVCATRYLPRICPFIHLCYGCVY